MRYSFGYLGLVALGLMMAGGCGDSAGTSVTSNLTADQQAIIAWMDANNGDPNYQVVAWMGHEEKMFSGDDPAYYRMWLRYRENLATIPTMREQCFSFHNGELTKAWGIGRRSPPMPGKGSELWESYLEPDPVEPKSDRLNDILEGKYEPEGKIHLPPKKPGAGGRPRRMG